MDFKFTGMDGDGDKLSSPRSSLLQNKVRQSCLLSSRTRSVELSPAVRSVSRYCQTVKTSYFKLHFGPN